MSKRPTNTDNDSGKEKRSKRQGNQPDIASSIATEDQVITGSATGSSLDRDEPRLELEQDNASLNQVEATNLMAVTASEASLAVAVAVASGNGDVLSSKEDDRIERPNAPSGGGGELSKREQLLQRFQSVKAAQANQSPNCSPAVTPRKPQIIRVTAMYFNDTLTALAFDNAYAINQFIKGGEGAPAYCGLTNDVGRGLFFKKDSYDPFLKKGSNIPSGLNISKAGTWLLSAARGDFDEYIQTAARLDEFWSRAKVLIENGPSMTDPLTTLKLDIHDQTLKDEDFQELLYCYYNTKSSG